MQRWMKINKLGERVKETKARLAETKTEYRRSAKLVKENSKYCADPLGVGQSDFAFPSLADIIKMQSEEILENRAAKVAMLQAKLEEIEQKIEKEQTIMGKVQQVMPVKIEQNNANDSVAVAAIANAIDELQKYYSIDFDGNSYDGEFDISSFFVCPFYFLFLPICSQCGCS